MNAQEIRAAYLKFFEDRGHKVIPRALLVPDNDPTTLFTGSGMQPLLPYLLGEPHPEGNRLVDSQTSFRTEDIEEIGDNRHTTQFEMLGNWSLGDYFKKEQLSWFWEFLTEIVGLDPQYIYISVFSGEDKYDIPKDDESVAIWQELYRAKGIDAKAAVIGPSEEGSKIGMQGGRIFYYDSKKNWWSRVGPPDGMPEGEPGGPDSEAFYLFKDVEHDPQYGEQCHPNCDCGRFLEIGNSVFMQYVKNAQGGFDELPQKNVDFGGGLERIAAAAIDDPDVFKISLMWPVVEKLQELTGKKYEDHLASIRVITDHLRAAVWLAVDGVTPSNTAQGYVLRRLVRRAVRYAFDLGIEADLIARIAPSVVEIYQDFPDMQRAREAIEALAKEEKTFRQTLRAGVRTFQKGAKEKLTGQSVFKLYDTYGFPKELSLEEADKANIPLADNWTQEFDKLMSEQRERSRTATKGQFKGGLAGHSAIHKKYHTATHLLYESLRQVLGDHVIQRGSNITEERLRFDFTHPEKVTPEQLKQVEDLVNQQIDAGLEVTWKEYPTDEALQKGALGHFGERYGDSVKVYRMGHSDQDPFSFEICGGPHVDNTKELAEDGKRLKITKEEASSAGIRRIKAILV